MERNPKPSAPMLPDASIPSEFPEKVVPVHLKVTGPSLLLLTPG